MSLEHEEWFLTNDVASKKYVYEAYNQEINTAISVSDNVIIDMTTAFFNIQGWELIKKALSNEKISKLRILIGSEPSLQENVRGKLTDDAVSELDIQKRNEAMLLFGRNDIEVNEKLYKLMNDFCQWLNQGIILNKIEIRLYNKYFLHGKTIHINSEKYNSLIIGSANFTSAGLRKNREAVTKQSDTEIIKQANKWFEDAWDAAVPYENKLLELYSAKVDIHDPKLIYMKFLESYFKDIELQNTYENSLIENPWLAGLAEFQIDGAIRAQKCLDAYNGVLIADEVGLGKTYIAGSLIKKASMEGKGVLIVAPPSIASSVWEKYIVNNELKRNVQLTTFDKLKNKKLFKGEVLEPDHFNMIIVDEAHYIRNENQRYTGISEGILPKMINPQIIFLTATPINNSLMDIYNLIKLFIKDNFMRDKNIWSLEDEFYRKSNKKREPDKEDWRWIWFLLDKISVRRTREYIRSKYSNIMLDGEEWTFPTLEPPKKVEYGVSDEQKTLIEEVIHALRFEEFENFSLAAYDIYSYMKDKPDNPPPTKSLVGTTLLKRLESSTEAFRSTCSILLERTEQRLIEANNIFIEKSLLEDSLYDSNMSSQENPLDIIYDEAANALADDIEDLDEESTTTTNEEIAKASQAKKTMLVLNPNNFDDEGLANFIHSLNEDKIILKSWLQKSIEASIEDNYKVIKLLKLINKIGIDNPNYEDGNKRKMVIFTSSAKTAEWLENAITEGVKKLLNNSDYNGLLYYNQKGKITSITGSSKDKEEKLKAFAPNSMNGIKEKNFNYGTCDIIIATDVLAEGVNLQQAGIVINYDLPWNPMRVVQRVGRIDRIMSQHDMVFNYCFFPKSDIFKDYLSLYAKLKYKMTLALNTMGERDVIGVIESSDSDSTISIGIFGSDSREEAFESGMEEIAQQIALNNEQAVHSVDLGDLEVIEEWYKKYERTHLHLKELPLAAGTVFRSDRHNEDAWVFCTRIVQDNLPRDFSKIRFIIIKDTDPTKTGYVDTFEALSISDPRIQDWLNNENNLETVTEEKEKSYFNNLFDIWKIASNNIVNDWNNNINNQTSRNKTKVKLPARIIEAIEKDLKNNLNKFSKGEEEYIKSVINSELLGYQISLLESVYNEYEDDKKIYKDYVTEIESNIIGSYTRQGKRYIELPLSKRIFERSIKNAIHPNNEKIDNITVDNIELIAWARILPKIYGSTSPDDMFNILNSKPAITPPTPMIYNSAKKTITPPPQSNVIKEKKYKKRNEYKPRDLSIEEKIIFDSDVMDKLNKLRNPENE